MAAQPTAAPWMLGRTQDGIGHHLWHIDRRRRRESVVNVVQCLLANRRVDPERLAQRDVDRSLRDRFELPSPGAGGCG